MRLTKKTIGLPLAVSAMALAVSAWAADDQDHSSHQPAAAAGAASDHSEHAEHAGLDAEGRRFHGMQHKMPPEMYVELREKIGLYKNYTDQQIDLSMVQMGSEYEWYISPRDLRGKQGLLIMSHGFRDAGDKIFKSQLQPLADVFPSALAIGMAMMMSDHIQASLDDLVAAGAEQIVVVPIVSTENNELKRQWDYILGQQDHAEFATVRRVNTKAKLIFADPPNDNPLIAEILLDHAREIGKDPANEVVVVVAHGATEDKDNVKEAKILASLASLVREDGGYADAVGIALQDDAPREVRAKNVAKLRKIVESATADGRQVLIVTNLIGARTIQAKLRSDLKGLDYNFNAKGIAQHDNFIEWLGDEIREKLETT